jgi:Fic family protein
LFALDEYFEQDRQLYYDKIQQARDLDDDLSYWLEYIAQGIVVALERTQKRILSLRIRAKFPRIVLTKRQEDVLRFLRDKGRAKTPDIQNAFKLTRSRINQILKPLLEAGLVKRQGQTRSTSYGLAE